jgi:hypothetical protein
VGGFAGDQQVWAAGGGPPLVPEVEVVADRAGGELVMSKAMAAWEPVVEDAARKQGRVPVTLRCECTPPRSIFASTGTAIGPNSTSELCSKAFRISPGQRIGKADQAEPTRSVPVTGTTSR